MNTSETGISALKKFEGFISTWTKDVNNLSIGYGHNKLPGDNFTRLTESQASELLKKDLAKFEQIINDVIKIPINQNQFDALILFVYNTGKKKSDLYDLINNKSDIETIIQWWNQHYISANGEILPGLIKRRAYESALFASGAPGVTDQTKNVFLPGIAILIILGIILKRKK
jgi:lysozyme